MPAQLTKSLASAWLGLPEALRQRLGLASTGWRHLARCGRECLGLARNARDDAARARLLALAADLFLRAWGENPLCGPLAAEILAHADLPLPHASRAALYAVAENWREPGDKEGGTAYFQRLLARGDPDRLAQFLAGQIARDPAGLFWRAKALDLDLDALALNALESLPGLAPVARSLQAQAAFLRGDAQRCLDGLASLDDVFGPAFGPARTGLALLRAGDEAAALPHLRAALILAPWQASLALVAADAATGMRSALAPPPGPALVLLHTRDNAAQLDATLGELFASDLCGARVAVLDQGSTDETAQVLAAWRERAGEGLLCIGLPVDIGAPAARNWLCALPEAKSAASLALVDDDILLPPDWLQRLGAALAAFPDAGAAGCSVAAHEAPQRLHSAAGQLVIPPEAAPDRPDLDFQSLTPNPLGLCDAHSQGPDWSLFEHLGPCASVSGRCLLVRRADLDAPFAQGGGFSLALGPTGTDGPEGSADFERDLRRLIAGGFAAHQGHLRVLRRGVVDPSPDMVSNAQGNRYKLQTMHPREEIAGLLTAQALRLGEAVDQALGVLDRPENQR